MNSPKFGVGWQCCLGIGWEPIRKRIHMQLVRERLSTVISACWAALDWSWPKSRSLLSTKKKKKKKAKSASREWFIKSFPQILVCEGKPTTTVNWPTRHSENWPWSGQLARTCLEQWVSSYPQHHSWWGAGELVIGFLGQCGRICSVTIDPLTGILKRKKIVLCWFGSATFCDLFFGPDVL